MAKHLADKSTRVILGGRAALHQYIATLQVTVQQANGVQIAHPRSNVAQAQQNGELHGTATIRR